MGTRGPVQPETTGAFGLAAGTVEALHRMNPWWQGKPGPVLPLYRRHLVAQIQRRLEQRLAPVVVVRGARQIGKTTAQLQTIDALLAQGMSGRAILRVQFDEIEPLRRLTDPLNQIVTWYERKVLGKTLNEAARDGEKTLLVFDEVQNLTRWAEQLKSLIDTTTTQVLVTGSSALRLELGRDSLAGRISTIEAGVLTLTEIAGIRGEPLGEPMLGDNGLRALASEQFWRDLAAAGSARREVRDRVFAAFSARGGYPLAHARADVSWEYIADQINENVVRRVIQHDLRVGDSKGRKRDAALLEETFRCACRYAGQTPAVHTLAEQIRLATSANLGDARVRSYMQFLADALLVRLIEPLEIRLKRKRGAPKLCLADHVLRASWLQEPATLDPALLSRGEADTVIAGHLAESVAGAMFRTIHGLDVNYMPARNNRDEIDFVLTVGDLRIPIEVKYQATLDPRRDGAAVRGFIEAPANRAMFGLIVTRSDGPHDFGEHIVALPLSSLLMLR